MNLDRVVLVLLAIFALLFGMNTVTNVRFEFMTVIMGLAALCLGIVCLIRAFK